MKNSSFSIVIRHLHISHSAPYLPPQNVAEALFSISLGMAVIPRGNEIQRLCNIFFFGGGGGEANKVHYGRCESRVFKISAV